MHEVIEIALPLAAIAANGSVAAALAGGQKVWKSLALAIATAGLAIPFALPVDFYATRFLGAIGALWGFAMAAEILRDKSAPRLAKRLTQMFTVPDSRRLERVAPAVDWKNWALQLVWSVVCLAGIGAAVELAPAGDGLDHYAVRWLGGALFMYAGVEAVAALLTAIYRAFGFVPDRLHNAPVLSRTVAEFWGERWNRTVASILRRQCFWPLARRRHALAGIGLSFLVSASGHAYLSLVPLGFKMAALMGCFFLAQFLLIVCERALGVRRWPAPLAHGWTATGVLITSPLFVAPGLRIFEPLWHVLF